MDGSIRAVDGLRTIQTVGDRNAGQKRGNKQAFKEALDRQGEEQDPSRGGTPEAPPRPQKPMPSRLQQRRPAIRKDPVDGTLHVDFLA